MAGSVEQAAIAEIIRAGQTLIEVRDAMATGAS
jgi:hypothetical protein